jgi:hypothetical protein
MFGEGRDRAGCGFDPRFLGGSWVFTRALIGGPWRGFELLGRGRQRRGWGGENSPGPRAGPPGGSLVPSSLSVPAAAVVERAGRGRLTIVPAVGQGLLGAVSPASAAPMTTATR